MTDALTWSPSRSRRWRECPRQFLFNDVLGAPPAQPDPPHFLRGSLIHAGMEGAIRAVAAGKHRHARTLAGFLDEANDAMRAHPAAAQLPEPTVADCHRVLADAMAGLGVPMPASIIGVEWKFVLRHNGIMINGAIDLVLRTGPASLRVLDWKSGKIPERSEAIEGHTALGIYSIAAMRAWRWASAIEVGLYSIPHDQSVNLIVTRAMQELVLDRVSRDYHAAQHARALLSPESVDEAFPTRSGDHCGSCRFRSYCPLFGGSALPVRPGVDVEKEREHIARKITLSG